MERLVRHGQRRRQPDRRNDDRRPDCNRLLCGARRHTSAYPGADFGPDVHANTNPDRNANANADFNPNLLSGRHWNTNAHSALSRRDGYACTDAHVHAVPGNAGGPW